jgi:hypothetical protein
MMLFRFWLPYSQLPIPYSPLSSPTSQDHAR